MGSLLSTLTGGVTGPLLRAGLFPAAIFTILTLLLLVPLAPESLGFFERLGPVSTEWEVAALTFLTAVLAGLLYALSTPLVRFFEGYPWQGGALGRWLGGRQRREFGRLTATLAGLERLRDEALERGSPDWREINHQVSRLKIRLRYRFPERESLVLPTRLGNVVRSFERYSAVEYGMEAVVLWPHLQSVIEPGYGSRIDDARYNVSFLLNTAFLLGALAFLLLLLAAVSSFATPGATLLPAALLAVGSLLLYHGALRAADTWGSLVRGAFDLYRGPLLEKLGHGAPPAERAREREIWGDVTAQVIFGDRKGRPRTDPAPSPTGPSHRLATARGMRSTSRPGRVRVVTTVTNEGDAASPRPVVISDAPPEGFAYVWGSAWAADGVRVDGAGPYTFSIDRSLAPQESLTFAYDVLDLRPGTTHRGGAP